MKNLILLFISLFIFSCDSDSNPVGLQCESFGLIEQDGLCVDECGVVNGDNSTCTDNQMEIDVDWIFLKKNSSYSDNGGCSTGIGIGFNFCFENDDKEYEWFSSSNDIESDLSIDNGFLNIFDQGNEYVYDISDSFCTCESCCSNIYNFSSIDCNRIIYNSEMNFITCFDDNNYSVIINIEHFQIVDYR